MIDITPSQAPDAAASVALLPNRSMTSGGLWVFLAIQGLAAAGFAALAAWQGNIFAPLFAILEMGVVAYCLRRAWIVSGCGQIITLTPTRIAVVQTPDGEPVADFHPYWTRASLELGQRGSSRLMLGSHGRYVEIGAFLRDDERRALARQLAALIAQSTSAAAPTTNCDA
jgi:uncharacterized membrane protein